MVGALCTCDFCSIYIEKYCALREKTKNKTNLPINTSVWLNYSPGCHSAGVNREVWIHYTKKRTTSTFVETMMLVSQLCKRGTTVFKKRWLKACYEKDDATNVICILVTYLR